MHLGDGRTRLGGRLLHCLKAFHAERNHPPPARRGIVAGPGDDHAVMPERMLYDDGARGLGGPQFRGQFAPRHVNPRTKLCCQAGSRNSPQVNIVVHIAKALGVPCRSWSC
jgi:hypothetical protein